jgi:tRNA(Ile)-lysidine synthase
LGDLLVKRVAEILTRYNMLSPGYRVGIAVSGGADSCCLLHILQRLSEEFKISLIVLHVNHRLRGPESDGDEEFVRALALSLSLELVVDRPTLAAGNLEQEARDARRAFFGRARTECKLDRIALGHTRSDQAETVLSRLLRGSGLAGLAGMRPVSPEGFIRPLLTTSRDEVRTWAREEGVAWRDDSSNRDLEHRRNRLRLETLPALARDYNPNLETILSTTAHLAQAEESYWNEEVERHFPEIAKRTQFGWVLRVTPLLALHPALQRRLIRRAVLEQRGNLRGIGMEHIEDILKISDSGHHKIAHSAHGHDRVLIPGVDALRSFDQLLLAQPGTLGGQPRHYCLSLEPGTECNLPFHAGLISMGWLEPGDQSCVNFKKGQDFISEESDLDGDLLAQDGALGRLQVRNWQPGDGLHRPGHRSIEKIKTLFQESRVALWERKHWPVVVAGEEIIWARQFGRAERFGVSAANHRILRLVYKTKTLSETYSTDL